MEYRGVEYTVVQGIESGIWKWTAWLGEPKIIKVGQAKTKRDAVVAVEYAIDKVLTRKKLPIVLPRPSDWQTRGLMLIGEHGGDPMMAYIAMMRALQRHEPKPVGVPRRKSVKVYKLVR
jgi:hypothetical protein